MTQESLEAKREQLEQLEKSEREARRLEDALGRGRNDLSASSVSSPNGPDDADGNANDESHTAADAEPSERLAEEQSAYLPPHPGPNPVRRRAPGMGLLNALSYTLHGMMDVDPETARRNGISKTRETISQVRKHRCHDVYGS